jgi:hypothetical protein
MTWRHRRAVNSRCFISAVVFWMMWLAEDDAYSLYQLEKSPKKMLVEA